MARLFDDASSQYLRRASTVLTDAPITMACWFKVDTTAMTQHVMGFGASDASGHWIRMVISDSGNLYAQHRQGSASNTAISTSTLSTGTWHLGVAVFEYGGGEITSTVYLDGGSKATLTDADAFATVDETTIGVRAYGSDDQFLSGAVAYAAMWDVAFSDANVTSLWNSGNGVLPTAVQGANLQAYWPLIDDDDDDENSHDLTAYGSPTFTDGPTIGGGSSGKLNRNRTLTGVG